MADSKSKIISLEGSIRELSIAKEVGDRAREEQAYYKLSFVYLRLGKFREAIEYAIKHLSIAKEMGDKVGEGRAYCNVGCAYQSLGNFKEAVEYQNKYLDIAKGMGDKVGEGRAYSNLGNAYQSLGNVHKAIEYHVKHLSISNETDDKTGEARAYGHLGNAYDLLGNFHKAIEYHKKRLSLAKEMGDKGGEGCAYANLGNACYGLGNAQEAIGYHNKGLAIFKQVGNKVGEGNSYSNLGIAYERLGKFKEAIEYYNNDLSIAQEIGNRYQEGRAYGNLGTAFRNLGSYKEAIQYHNKALYIAKESGNKQGEGSAYCNLGNAFQNLGNFQEAIKYHEKHLYITQKISDRAGEGRAYGNLGNDHISLGDFEKAIENYEKRLSIAKEVRDRTGEGRAYGSLGNAYEGLGDLQRALEYHKKHLTIAIETEDKDGEARAYCNLGNAYQGLGNSQEAINHHTKSLSIAKELGDRELVGRAYGNLGEVYQTLGNFQEASEYYQSSVNILDVLRASLQAEDVWKISFRDIYHDSYTALWGTLLKLQKIDEALCAAEQGRAQALVDDLQIQYDGITVPPQLDPKETISHLSNELSTTTVFVGLERNKINFWVINKGNKVEFRHKEVEGAHARKDCVAILLETTLKKIGAGVGVNCENRSLDELSDDSSSNREGAEEQAESSHCNMDSLQPLYDAVIDPIVDLCQNDELIIVPDGPLCLTPLSALSESIRIRTVPSLTSLKLITASPKHYHSRVGVLLVGNPCLEEVTKTNGTRKYEDLKNAKKEVDMIAEILKVSPLTGKEATKQKVLESISAVELVHIAAHGGKESGEIALAPNPGWEEDHDQRSKSKSKKKIPKDEDYILKLSDVQAVRLRARLVVLSCCHSGRGEVKSEGVVGIARAFLAAGARSVLASLWAIDDEATMEFMKSFYQHLTDGKSASVALHQAMKSIRESTKFSAIKYWAPFVLIGDDVHFEFGEKEEQH